jgi:hypothetical protein
MDAVSGAPVTTAAVTANVTDLAGGPIGGPYTLTHTAGGLYTGVIPDTLPLTPGDRYRVVFFVNDGTNRKRTIVQQVVVEED